jgi:long-chain fatty acid transport protein
MAKFRLLIWTESAPDDQIAHLKGDEWGFGWNAGILYELDKNNRWGLTYRSEVKIDFDGDYKSSINPNLSTILGNMGLTGLPAGTGGRTENGSLSLHLPEMWEISGYNRVAPQWAIHYSLTYTSWSQFQELKATGDNGQTLFYKDESFKDAYRIALGTTYYYDKNWTFRTGIAFDDSPVPADKRSISIPDQDRLWLSAGATYAFNDDASIDVGASYMHGQKVNFTEGEGAGLPSTQKVKPGCSVRTSTTRSNRTEIKKGEHCSPFLFTANRYLLIRFR